MRWWIGLGVLAVCVWYFWGNKPEIKNADRPVQTIVAFGDSLTAGYGAGGVQNSFPAVLERLSNKKVINMGLSGDTADNAPTRIDEVLAASPDMVLIEFGGNDRIRGLGYARAAEAVAQIVDAVQSAGAIAVIVDTGGPQMNAYSVAYKKIAKEKQAIFVPGILKGIFNKSAYKSDMVHPNAAGDEIIAQRVYKEIKPYL